MSSFMKVMVEFKAVTPLFSSGESVDSSEHSFIGNKKYLPLRLTGDGKVLIPFKGRLRMATEQILKDAGENVCDLDKDMRGCGRCKACDIYGSMQKRGRWLIGSLISKDFSEDITGVFTHLKTRRNSMTIDTKKVYNLQEVKAGSIFLSEIIITHPKPDDEKILKASLNFLRYFGVGGLITKGYGRIEVISYKKEEYNYKDFLNGV